MDPAGAADPAGAEGTETAGGEDPAGTEGTEGTETAGAGTTGADDGAVLERAVEVFKRSASRSRSTDVDDGDPADSGPMGEAGGEPGGTPGDLDDLVTGDIDDLITGGGAGGGGEESEAQQETAATGPAGGGPAGGGPAGGAGEGDDDAMDGPWHQPGAAGRGADPTSEEVYAGNGDGDDAAEAAGAPAQTAGERHGELERILAEAMGDFDGRILEERETILARRGRDTDEIDGAAGGGGRAGEGDGEGQAAGGDGRDAAGRRPAPPAPAGTESDDSMDSEGSVGGPAAPTQTARADIPIPEDVGDGANDDVVARQLREAAMNETDPELREKLWDEYRRYVSGRR